MEYLEAVAIKRLRPDSVPGHLAHLLDEADRVIKLKHAMCSASDSQTLRLELPVLAPAHRERLNLVLLARLALACGRLQCWGGPGRQQPAQPIKWPALGEDVSVAVPAAPQHAPLVWETTT